MKTFATILFLISAAASVAFGSVEGAVVSAAGLLLTNGSYLSRHFAYITVVPGIMTAINPKTGMLEEVPPMTRAEKALYDYLTKGKANIITLEAILSGAVSFDPISYYVRFNLTNLSGNQIVVGPSTLEVIGTTNFPNGATLQQYYNFCFDRIAVRYAIVASANAAVASTSGYSSVAASMDPALRNGELIIKSNRNTIVETPVIDFVSQAAVTGAGTREADGGILEKPRFFLEQLQIEVQIALAGQIPNTANNTFLGEIVFSGVQARLKY